jgi:hypothetical protein
MVVEVDDSVAVDVDVTVTVASLVMVATAYNVVVVKKVSVTALSVTVLVLVLIIVEVDTKPTKVVMVDWTASVCVGPFTLVRVTVVVGTLATDAVLNSVRQTTPVAAASEVVIRSGKTATVWCVNFMMDE